MKILASILLLIAFVANILVPIHSDWVFFALSLDEPLRVLVSGVNNITQEGFGNTWTMTAPLSAYVTHSIFYTFGESGLGVLMILLYANFALSVFGILLVQKNSSLPVVLVLSVLCVGASLYGLDLGPTLFLSSVISLDFFLRAYSKNKENYGLPLLLVSMALFVLALFLNVYAVFSLVLLPIAFVGTRSQVFFRLGIVLALMIFPMFREMLFSAFTEMQFYLLVISKQYLGFFTGSTFVSFSIAFYLLLLGVFLFTVKVTTFHKAFWALGSIVFLPFLSFSPLLLITASFLLALGIARKFFEDQGSSQVKEGLCILSDKLNSISYASRVFFLTAWVFVSIVSFMKLPFSDFGFPAKKLDAMIDQGRCITESASREHLAYGHSIKIGGYIAYRYSHDELCKPWISLYTLSSLKNSPELADYVSDYLKPLSYVHGVGLRTTVPRSIGDS